MNPSNAEAYFNSPDEVEAIVRSFETCEVNPDDFKHPSHLAVALWYLSKYNYEEAAERMRAGLCKLLGHYQLEGYNETITLFWLRATRQFLDQSDRRRPISELASELVQTHGSSRLIYDYYSKELISSAEAKTSWVEPDLKPLDF
ncbi:MAG TPA: hypothetical protein VGB17_01260 [Pyrinomonadaceae bacterium]|jgi:hypothetical protein